MSVRLRNSANDFQKMAVELRIEDQTEVGSVCLLIVFGDPVFNHDSHIFSVVDLLVAAFDVFVEDGEPKFARLLNWEILVLDATWSTETCEHHIFLFVEMSHADAL